MGGQRVRNIRFIFPFSEVSVWPWLQNQRCIESTGGVSGVKHFSGVGLVCLADGLNLVAFQDTG